MLLSMEAAGLYNELIKTELIKKGFYAIILEVRKDVIKSI